MIAGLPMYDRPETAPAHDAFWTELRDDLRGQGIDAPDTLTRDREIWALWQAPDLLLGQTCNLPLRARLHDRVHLIGNPDLGLDDTPPGHYHSLFVTRKGASRSLTDHRDGRFAFNDALSHSGWIAPQTAAAAQGFAFTALLETGSHAASADALADGRADVAGIDAHTWRILTAHARSTTDKLQVIGRTAASPAPPYITAFADLVPVLRRALHARLPGADLGIRGLVSVPFAEHMNLPIVPPAKAPAA